MPFYILKKKEVKSMKFKKIAAGIVASTMTITAVATPFGDNLPIFEKGIANSASAACLIKEENPEDEITSGSSMWMMQVYNEGNEEEGKPATVHDIDNSEVTGVRFTITVPEYDANDEDGNREFWTGDIGGDVVLSINGGDITQGTDEWDKYNWQRKTFWGVQDPELEIDTADSSKDIVFEKVGDYTYQITANGFENPLANGAVKKIGCIQVALEEWGNSYANIRVTKCEILDKDGEVLLTHNCNYSNNTAYLTYSDSDFYPCITDDSGFSENSDGTYTLWDSGAQKVTKSGTYTVSISDIKSTVIDEETGDEMLESVAGKGASFLSVNIKDLAYRFNIDYRSNKDTLGDADSSDMMALAKSKKIGVSNVKVLLCNTDGTTKTIPVDSKKIMFGDLDHNGKFVIEIYSEYGLTKNDPPINKNEIKFDDSITVSFDITLPELTDYEYMENDDGDTVSITGYKGTDTDIILPSEIEGRKVASIWRNAFADCTELTSITIPDSVTSIQSSAFENCTGLTSVNMPNSVTYIARTAFYNCTSLKSVTIPASVTDIGSKAFGYYGNDDETKTIDGFKINYTKNTYGHYYATSNGFSNETCLITENLDDGTLAISEYAGVDKTFSIPSEINGKKVTEIGVNAFYNCSSLTTVTIPNTVRSIGSSAFSGAAITEIVIPGNIEKVGAEAFIGCKSLASVTIEDGVKELGNVAFAGTAIKEIVIPDSVTHIGGGLFQYCENLEKVVLSKSITEISNYSLSCCYALKSIVIPEGVKVIGSFAFTFDKSLESVTLPKSLTDINRDSFKGCESLKELIIPENVVNFGDDGIGGNNVPFDDTILLKCYPGTAAEKYAKENGLNYKLIDKVTAPAKVTGVKLTGRAADALRINWTKNAKADGYIVEIYKDGKWARAAKITSNATTTYRASGLKASTVYKFRVKAYKMYGSTAAYSDYSAELAARTNPSVMAGAKLTGRAADALRINWTKNASADGYIVEMYQGNKWVRAAKITNNNTTTFRKAGLKASSVYKFRVRAYKMSGKTALYSDYSATVAARTNPSVVKGAKLTGRAADALRINWTKNTTADGYIVEMYKGGKWVRAAKITKNSTTTYRASGLKASTVYKFRVRAYKMSGKTALYGNYSATVTARTNPSAVKGVKIGGKAKDALRVNWTKNASAQGYIVEMYKGGKWVRVAKITKNSTNTYRKAGLAKNTTYKFRVKAYYMSGKTALYGGYGSVSGKTAVK